MFYYEVAAACLLARVRRIFAGLPDAPRDSSYELEGETRAVERREGKEVGAPLSRRLRAKFQSKEADRRVRMRTVQKAGQPAHRKKFTSFSIF